MSKNSKLIVQLLPVLSGFFVMGFCDIVGILSDYVQKSFNWSDAMTGFVPSLVFIWFLFLGIPVGNMMNKCGRKNMVLFSMIVTVLGSFLPLFVFNSITCIIAFICIGVGNVMLQISLNPLLTNIITSEKLLTSSITGGQVIKAISSLLGPEIVIFAVVNFGQDYWYYSFPILGAITLLSAIWIYFTPIVREAKSSEEQTMKDTFCLLKNKTILMLFFGIFFIVGLDVTINYMSSKIMDARFMWSFEKVKFAPQLYFLFRTIGAFVGTFMLARVNSVKYLRANLIAVLLSLIILALVPNETVNLVCIAAVGFFASSVFSIIYSVAISEMPDKANQISGLLITAIAGGGIVTPIVGAAIGSFGIEGGVAIMVIFAVYLLFNAFNLTPSLQK